MTPPPEHCTLQAGGWAEDDSYGVQDWELFSRAVLAGYRLEVVPRALYWYRTNSHRCQPSPCPS